MEVHLRDRYMENILTHLIRQIMSTYSREFLREMFTFSENMRVLTFWNIYRMEFVCDSDGINFFTEFKVSKPPSSKSSNRPLVVTFDGGVTLFGHYTYDPSGVMVTHFVFTPTSDGMIRLLKLVDHSIHRLILETVR